MLTDKEFNEKIETVCTEFVGDLDDLYSAVGLVVVGRLYGWKVMRLVSSGRHWTLAGRLFGDPKLLMRERDVLTFKSVGLSIADKAGEYWEFVKRHKSIPIHERKAIQ